MDKIVKASRDPGLRRIINDCDLINADGDAGGVGLTRLLGKPLKERVTGVDLFEALMARAAQKNWRVFLLGAREEVVSGVARLYPARYPGLTIAGYRNGYWSKKRKKWSPRSARRGRTSSSWRSARPPRRPFWPAARRP